MSCFARIFAARELAACALLFCALGLPACAFAQAPPSPNNQQQSTQPATPQQKPATPPIQPVTTTVVVHGNANDDYLPESVTVGTLTGEALKDLPLSANVVTRDLLNDQVARLLSDVVKNDASVTDDYVPVGYYGDYQILGFPLDLATGFQVNGMHHCRRAGCSTRKQAERRVPQRHCRH